MNYQQKAEAYVREKCPELMELSFGCEVMYSQFNAIKGVVLGVVDDEIYTTMEVDTPKKKHLFHIIGHPIQLQHWLRVLRIGHIEAECRWSPFLPEISFKKSEWKDWIYFNLTTGQPTTEADYQAFCEIVGISK